ncbi:MAG: hypothetical protein AAGU12_02875 [Clostridiales bacterium]
MARFTLFVTSDIEEGLDILKKEKFTQKSKTKLIHYVLTVGLAMVRKQKEQSGQNKPANPGENETEKSQQY